MKPNSLDVNKSKISLTQWKQKKEGLLQTTKCVGYFSVTMIRHHNKGNLTGRKNSFVVYGLTPPPSTCLDPPPKALPTGDKVFKYMRLRGTLSVKSPHSTLWPHRPLTIW